MDKLYTAQEIADKLKIKKNTVYELIKRGELKSTKIGKQIRISQHDIDVYLNQPAGGIPSSSFIMNDDRDSKIAVESSVVKRDYLKYSNGLIISGHEPLLDFLCSQINIHPDGLPTLRSHAGSYDSLYSLYFNKIHIAAVHLWDNEENTYNTSYIKRFLPGVETVVVSFLKRMQGFYVYRNNPKKILTFKDLTRNDIRMVNRELGSGTRILLDEKLSMNRVNHDLIRGYDNEVLSHFASASKVAARDVDVAIGCENYLNQFSTLDFVPIQQESYDLVFLKSDFEKPAFQALLEILNDRSFQSYIASTNGYDITDMGKYKFIN